MIIIFLAEEMNRNLGITLSVIQDCGFKTRIIGSQELRLVSDKEKMILVGKHPQRKHNGGIGHRRRFAFYECHGFIAIGYADGAKCDALWWRDLYRRLSHLIDTGSLAKERPDVLFALERLREMSQSFLSV